MYSQNTHFITRDTSQSQSPENTVEIEPWEACTLATIAQLHHNIDKDIDHTTMISGQTGEVIGSPGETHAYCHRAYVGVAKCM